MAGPGHKQLWALVALFVIIVGGSVAALALSPTPDESTHMHATSTQGDQATPERHTGPQGSVGQFIAFCNYSHSAPDDPIVHFSHPGRSHMHDFYGATGTNAFSTPEELLAGETTCEKVADKAAYWQPTLYDHDEVVEPIQIAAYYRAAPGVTPTDVEPFPFGLAMIAGDQTATTPQEGEAVGWTCGIAAELSSAPRDCADATPLTLLLTFQDCWDGKNTESEDHHAHVTYSSGGECPNSHPVHVPQLTVSIKFPIVGSGHDLRLASGNVYSAHGDFLNAWDPDGLQREIEACIHRGVVCNLANNKEDDTLLSSES